MNFQVLYVLKDITKVSMRRAVRFTQRMFCTLKEKTRLLYKQPPRLPKNNNNKNNTPREKRHTNTLLLS